MTFASQLSAAFTPIAAVYDAASTTQALNWAQDYITSYCNQAFDLVTADVAFIDPMYHSQAFLPQVPVVNVESVQALLPPVTSIPGTAFTWQTLTNYAFVAQTGLIYDTTYEIGVQYWGSPSWPWMPGSLQVTYDHGYATIPRPLISTGVRLAQQYLENPTLQMQRRIGDSEDRYAGSAGVLLNYLDKAILDRYTIIGIS
jgi:hypothetical protein